MLSVHLYDLNFHAFHGMYEGEALVGNSFQVNLTVSYDDSGIKTDDLNSLINYEDLFQIVKKRMAIKSPLLEEIAEAIILKIRHKYSMVKEISISIFKLQAPLENFQGKVGITNATEILIINVINAVKYKHLACSPRLGATCG